ncbi:hypothetical protein PPACK8108_LOCUS25332 [Phakopsora pachyrhizi]|uniref:Zinc finger PHD-type domain-containing protein n=1 Tax=Phakopsora pachyrhizi TaxID=170000 RepID=A0AAV0BUG4_PHAPC|nr:hypothetical protein PPACK8108_LOCUS25332 [Phakopsora pachyrhizi]
MTVETVRVCIAVFPAYHPQISTCGFWLRLGDDCQLAINPEQLPGPRGSLAGGRIGCSAVSKRGPRTRGRCNKVSLSVATSSELSEPVPSNDSTAIPVRKSRQLSSNHKVEKILSQLKESNLKHVPNLLRSFKSKKSESLASGEDDKSNFLCSKSLAKPTPALEDCTKCGIEFQPGLVSAWIKANKNQKSKVRTGSLINCFLSLEEVYAQGCWLECSNCSSSYHFGCLPADMKKDIAAQHKAERLLIMEQLEKNHEKTPGKIINPSEIPPERKERQPDLQLVTKCTMCFKFNGALCMKCGNNSDLKHQTTNASLSSPGSPPQESMGKLPYEAKVDELEKDLVSKDLEGQTLLFQCISCRRVAHYSCLPLSGEDYPTDLDKIAEYWQRDWSCANCDELSNIELENILAWRRPTIKKTSHTTLPLGPEQTILGSLHDSPRGQYNNKTRSDVKLPSWKHLFTTNIDLCSRQFESDQNGCGRLNDLNLEAVMSMIDSWTGATAKGKSNEDYGGRVDLDWDLELLDSFEESLFCPASFEVGYQLVQPLEEPEGLLIAEWARLEHFLSWA